MKNVNDGTLDVAVEDIEPHPANPREGDVGAIAESIAENGFYGRIVVQKSTGHIIAGNHRYKAACHLGYKTVPVQYVDVDDDRALRILTVDNRSNDLATYRNDELSTLLVELAKTPDGLSGTGFDGDDLDALLKDIGEPDFSDSRIAGDEQNTLIVNCESENELRTLYGEMVNRGHKCRIMS